MFFLFSTIKKGNKMGQYYLIVNVDKREYLDPHKFGEGAKLMEFGHSQSSILLALTVLLSNGNGRGGGDIFSSKFQEAQDKWEKAYRRYSDGKRKTRPRYPDEKKYNEPWIGHWAGDRIVVAGDYGEPLRWIEDATDEQLQEVANKCFSKGHNKKNKVTLYHWAEYGPTFKDISKKILEVLADADELPSEHEPKELRPDMMISAVETPEGNKLVIDNHPRIRN
jgi:hypothetical protein